MLNFGRYKLWLLVGGSLLLSLACYHLIQQYIDENTQRQVLQQQEVEAAVLVSQRDLMAGENIQEEYLVVRNYPQRLVQETWLRPSDAVAIIGLTTSRFVERGEPFTAEAIVVGRQLGLAGRLSAGRYAVTAQVSLQQLHHGLLQVGDWVTLRGRNYLSEQAPVELVNIPVIAFDQFETTQHIDMQVGGYLPTTITFEMTAEQAQQFEQIRQQDFALWLQHDNAYQPSVQVRPIKIHWFATDRATQHELF